MSSSDRFIQELQSIFTARRNEMITAHLSRMKDIETQNAARIEEENRKIQEEAAQAARRLEAEYALRERNRRDDEKFLTRKELITRATADTRLRLQDRDQDRYQSFMKRELARLLSNVCGRVTVFAQEEDHALVREFAETGAPNAEIKLSPASERPQGTIKGGFLVKFDDDGGILVDCTLDTRLRRCLSSSLDEINALLEESLGDFS